MDLDASNVSAVTEMYVAGAMKASSSPLWTLRTDQALGALRAAPGGEEGVLIGEIREKPAVSVLAVSSYGGTRIIDMLVGDPLPRIC